MSVDKNRFRPNVPYPFQNSTPVDPAIYEDNPEYFFNVRPRISVFTDYADKACWEAREEYFSIAGAAMPTAVSLMPAGVASWGCIDSVSGNATAQWMPELEKEQLMAFAWFTEIFALHDGTYARRYLIRIFSWPSANGQLLYLADYLDTNEYAQEVSSPETGNSKSKDC